MVGSGGEPDLSAPGTYGPDDPGGGEFLPKFGIRAWYNDLSLAPNARRERTGEIDASWSQILAAWPAIELDLADRGIDVESGILEQRSWRWLNLRILGLISTPTSRLYRTLSTNKGGAPHGRIA
ncbi:hypothetical protein [Nocardia sp. NPDC057455]|uniref:hypothetical protein n=1 Tax=Nocardia sp. NPDC057455 TaxID=3346138 RepID=UPI00366D7A36